MMSNRSESNDSKSDFRYEIVKEIGVLSTSPKNWHKELNMVAWNGKPAKFDIRDWHPHRTKMGRGVTLTLEEAKKLAELLQNAVAEAEYEDETENDPFVSSNSSANLYDEIPA